MNRMECSARRLAAAVFVQPLFSIAHTRSRTAVSSASVRGGPDTASNRWPLPILQSLQGCVHCVFFMRPMMSHCSGQSPQCTDSGNTMSRVFPSEQRTPRIGL